MMQQQTSSQTQIQPPLMTVPQVISTKDLSFLKDEMSWLLIAMKKCAHFATESTDSKIQQALQQVAQMHERHYNMLLQYLTHNNDQMMSTVPQSQSQ
jgi:hypothetical protein